MINYPVGIDPGSEGLGEGRLEIQMVIRRMLVYPVERWLNKLYLNLSGQMINYPVGVDPGSEGLGEGRLVSQMVIRSNVNLCNLLLSDQVSMFPVESELSGQMSVYPVK